MARFSRILYWFPGVPKIERVPQGYAKRWATYNSLADSEGPGDGRGLLLAQGDGCVVQYAPDRQRWDQLSDGVWIGAALDAVPADFLRGDDQQEMAVFQVKLGDGRHWSLPVLNPLAASCSLPMFDVRRGPDEWKRIPQDRYRELADEATAIAGHFRQRYLDGADVVEMPNARLRAFMARGLAFCYDLTVDEMSVLRLFDPRVYMPVAFALVDWLAMRELLDASDGDARNPTEATPATSDSGRGAPAS